MEGSNKPNADARSSPEWKRIAIRGAAGGAALGLVLVACTTAVIYYLNRPREWSTSALRVIQVRAIPVELMKRVGDQFKPQGSGITFGVDVQNATWVDLTLSSDLKVFSQTKRTHALEGTPLKVLGSSFIPAGNTVTVYLEAPEMCASDLDPRECYKDFFEDKDALVIFDQRDRYKIMIPKPMLTYDSTRHHYRIDDLIVETLDSPHTILRH